jgi:ferredoxin
VSVLNEVLSSRGLKPMRATAAFGPDAAETPRDPGRRRFLSRFAGRNPEMPGMTGTRELRAVQRSARREGLTPVNAFAVSIDRGRCNGCDACFRVCPEGALTIFKDENVPLSYKAAQASCTGCGLCVDICDQKATTVDRSTARDEWEIPLRTFRCRACGNESHEPSEAGKTSTYCRICSQTNHAKNLFVVLK